MIMISYVTAGYRQITDFAQEEITVNYILCYFN